MFGALEVTERSPWQRQCYAMMNITIAQLSDNFPEKNTDPSAQISIALILAGIQCKGITEIIESPLTRDHTQRLLKSLNANIIKVKERKGKRITKIKGQL